MPRFYSDLLQSSKSKRLVSHPVWSGRQGWLLEQILIRWFVFWKVAGTFVPAFFRLLSVFLLIHTALLPDEAHVAAFSLVLTVGEALGAGIGIHGVHLDVFGTDP